MTKSTLLHLRIPFSYYLLPVFLFACSLSAKVEWLPLLLAALSLHLFLYPASNAYNSYFDKDEASIGGLEHPPKVSKELYCYALLFDAIALLLGVFISWQFALMLLVYGLASKAYSHPAIRLKKMPYAGWFVAGFFQGYFTFLMAYLGLNALSIPETFTVSIQIPALLSALLLWGSYPMTQVYQHAEDTKRGDITISLKLGVLGTFHFTAVVFAAAAIGFLCFYTRYYTPQHALAYLLFLSPVLLYFGCWYLKCRKDPKAADFKHSMRLNMISATMMNLFFMVFRVEFPFQLIGNMFSRL